MTALHQLFERSASEHPERSAVMDPARDRAITYARLDELAESIARDLLRLGVGTGHRVGIYAPKSIPSVAAILGTLKTGGAYVPVDATAPPRRGVDILSDCSVSAIVVERDMVGVLREAWVRELVLHEFTDASTLAKLGCDLVLVACEPGEPCPVEDLAYILYTSGSTGKPKGVMHTHGSAKCFVDWCSQTFEPNSVDRFSSHAPFHFDLSILDLFVPLAHGASIVLIGEEDGKNP